jgi:hypothetical protein
MRDEKLVVSQAWWYTLLIPALGGRGRRISEFEASLVYRVSSRTARATQRNPGSKNKTKQNKTKQNKTKQNRNESQAFPSHSFLSGYSLNLTFVPL